jgi:pseudouridine-5'-phosphate glycosidase
MMSTLLGISPEVQAALPSGRVVALETTVVAHGLPYPQNLTTAQEMEAIVSREGATPASIAVMAGLVRVGLSASALDELATSREVLKLSRRDIAACLERRRTGATTVAATMILAHLTGIRVFATGGVGGVHRVPAGLPPTDVSADLPELARTPVCVVCSGAKSILDLPATLEWLETWGVPVIGYQTDQFPAFLVRSSGLPAPLRADTPAEVAAICRTHWDLGLGGVLVTVPIPEADAIDPAEAEQATRQALAEAAARGISGPATTPFLLKRMVEISGGATLRANIALLRNNAVVAARIAVALSGLAAG